MSEGKGLSVTAITIAVGLVAAWFLWGVSCAMYQAANPVTVNSLENLEVRPTGTGSGRAFANAGVATFIIKSFAMLPKLPSVIGFIFRERLWFAIVAAAVLAAVAVFGVVMKRTEAALAAPAWQRRRR
ncbi:hypothetical protein AYO47_07660 [Planctomyces sp. SCGC AG-212-M04]|nr:hypothetical protein AYO47_07660 [Planctomyces sp. SCGC AG-212-M04]